MQRKAQIKKDLFQNFIKAADSLLQKEIKGNWIKLATAK